MLFAHSPEAARVGIGRHAFKHHGCRAVHEGTVDDVAVARDPAYVSGAPENVVLLVIKGVLVRHARIHEVTAGGVDDALGFACGAGGIEDEQRVLCADFCGVAEGRGGRGQFIVPDVAVFLPRHLLAGPLDHQTFDVIVAMQQRLVDVALKVGDTATARRAIGSDDNFCARVVDPRGKRVRGEARENNRVDRAEAGTGEHRVGGSRDHGKVQNHPIALLDAKVLEDVREFTNFIRQLLVGDVLSGFIRIIGFKDDRGLIAAGR